MVTLYSLQILLEYSMVLQHRLLKMPQFFPGWREGIRSRVSEMSYSALWAYAVDAAWMWLCQKMSSWPYLWCFFWARSLNRCLFCLNCGSL